MKDLLKQYQLNNDMQYFELIADQFKSYNNQGGIALFNKMPKKYKIKLVSSALDRWKSGIQNYQLSMLVNNV